MNTKFQLLIIVIFAVFSLSLNFSAASKGDNNNGSKSENKAYVTNTSEEKLGGLILISATGPEHPISITLGNKAGSGGQFMYDDGAFHFFHFNRIKRLRKCVKNLCLFAKIFLFYTHIAVLVLEFMHLLHH